MIRPEKYITCQPSRSIGWMSLFLCLICLPAFAQNYQNSHRNGETLNRCQELEQALAKDWISGNAGTKDLIKELKEKVKLASRKYHSLRRQAERANCYEDLFIFGRTLRKTRKCRKFDRQMRAARRKYTELEDRLDNSRRPNSRQSRRESILAALARNNCGSNYRRHTRQRRRSFDSFFWDDNGEEYAPDDGSYDRARENQLPDTIQSYATYRTMCVRLCDGFYFPVSFSTLPSQFNKDANICQNKCAAPTRLFVYRNPGAQLEQMISLEGQAYKTIKNAWKYRKKFVDGCSCKIDEYTLQTQSPKTLAQQNEWQTQSQKDGAAN